MLNAFGYEIPTFSRLQTLTPTEDQKQVALIRGHAGFDSGAICTGADGQVLLTEVRVNLDIADKTAQKLEKANLAVLLMDEYDERLAQLDVDVVLSLHSDSCIEASGYKAAFSVQSTIPDIERRLLACIHQHYSEVTELTYHPNTLTHDMYNYHVFNKVAPDTPAVILEMGFLGGDQMLLVHEQDRVATGIVKSLLCFLDDEQGASE
ncbi:N-acetylmuramoyl-L-alanine amidase [Chloroflexi bacterium TSY]|nr:N-acetylmuramoyl-L-alanine amidase [Chloroflexi bacterium TSY]